MFAFALSAAAVALSTFGAPEKEGAAQPDPDAAWAAFAEERRGECVGPAGVLKSPISIEAGGRKFRLDGSRLVEVGGNRGAIKIGVISATKDDREVTVAAVKELIGWMRDRKMDFLIANGDLGSNEFELEATFGLLAEAGVLVLTHAGNTESCGSFNNVADATFRKKKTVLNGNWVRRLDLDGATFLTMPGYYDRRFAHTQGFARYKPEHVDLLGDMAKDAPKPLVLVSHGPPKMKGKNGIDVATDAGHVGDDAMAELIKRRAIPFGIFGHILEAGGRATDARGDATLGPGKWHPALFVNAGTANPDPWAMLDGSTSYGMGMFVEIEKGKARYEIKRLPQPE